jgi:hypothetical protein
VTGPVLPAAGFVPSRTPCPDAIRAELARRAAGVAPQPPHYIEDFEPPYGEAKDFCEPCAVNAASDLEVLQEFNSDSDVLRWCEGCGALLSFRIGPEEAEEWIEGFEVQPPSTSAQWAELLQAVAEVPPEDFRELDDPPVEPSLLWARVEAILRRSACPVPPELRPCEVAAAREAERQRRLRLAEELHAQEAAREEAARSARARPSPRVAMLVASLLGMAVAAGVDIEPPPRRGR